MVIGKPSSPIILDPIPSVFTLHLLPPSLHENCMDSVADTFHRPSDHPTLKGTDGHLGISCLGSGRPNYLSCDEKDTHETARKGWGEGGASSQTPTVRGPVNSNGMNGCCPTCWLKSMAFEVSEPSLKHLYAPNVCIDQLWLFHLFLPVPRGV